jgi:hypothetical protein
MTESSPNFAVRKLTVLLERSPQLLIKIIHKLLRNVLLVLSVKRAQTLLKVKVSVRKDSIVHHQPKR